MEVRAWETWDMIKEGSSKILRWDEYDKDDDKGFTMKPYDMQHNKMGWYWQDGDDNW